MSSLNDDLGPKSKEDSLDSSEILNIGFIENPEEIKLGTNIVSLEKQCEFSKALSPMTINFVRSRTLQVMNKVVHRGYATPDRNQPWYKEMSLKVEKFLLDQEDALSDLIKECQSAIPSQYEIYKPPQKNKGNVEISLSLPSLNSSTTTTTSSSLAPSVPSIPSVPNKRKRNEKEEEKKIMSNDELAGLLSMMKSQLAEQEKKKELEKIIEKERNIREEKEKIQKELMLYPFNVSYVPKKERGKEKKKQRKYNNNNSNQELVKKLDQLTKEVKDLKKKNKD